MLLPPSGPARSRSRIPMQGWRSRWLRAATICPVSAGVLTSEQIEMVVAYLRQVQSGG